MNSATFDPCRCWFLTGPTASGKTAVGLELAEILGAEIISMDSMALFRGMDVGTAKPTADERGRVPHHLIDVVDPDQDFSLAQYVEAAQRTALEIESRGRVPLFVGGTPLYLKSLLRGIFVGPPANWPLRRELQTFAEREGNAALHQRLTAVDPATAARLAVGDVRRVVRALEVFGHSGQSITTLQRQFDRARPAAECHVFVLDWPRAELVRRIDERVESMFQVGLELEVRRLREQFQWSRTALQAVGYREVIEYLDGVRNLEETKELVKVRTRQFSKRQGTWFRSLSECRPLPMGGYPGPRQVAKEIARQGV